MKQQTVSSQLDMAPVIFPKPPSRDEEEGAQRSIHVFESLRRHRNLVTTILLIFLFLSAFLLWRRRNPIYEATSRIYVSPAAPKALTDAAPQIGPYDSYVEEQIKTVTRYDVLLEAIRKMPAGSTAYWGPTEAKALGALQKTLTIVRLGESFDVEISLDGPEPHLVTDMVNTITNTYIEKERHEEFFARDQQLATLRDEVDHLQKELASKQTEEQALLRDLGVGSVQSNESSPYNLALAKLHADLTEAQEQYNAARSSLASLQGGGASAPGMQAAAQDLVTSDQALNALKTSLTTQRGTLVQQMSGLTPSNPVYKQDEEQVKSIDAQISKNAAELLKEKANHLTDKANADIRQKAMVVSGLERQLLQQTQQATGSAGKFQQAQQVQADTENLQKELAALQERMRQLAVDSGAPGSIHLLSPAMVPTGPNKNKTVILAVILLLFSAGASVGSAVALDYFDPHIYGADDVKQVMGFPPLGMLLDHDHFSAEVSQQYLLRLAAAVHHAVRASGARTFLFTATEPESGTTTLVEKVARQLRSLNMRTLTIAATNVDGKITYVSTTPSAEMPKDGSRDGAEGSRQGSGPMGPSLSDKLVRQQPGPLALNVHVGEPSNTMFSGSFVAQILNEHQNDYDVVLIDGGPILISADAEYLARIADGTVIVTQSGRTTRNQLRRSASLLEKLHVPGVAVVLNRITPERADAALRQDIQDFQQQLKKQRGTGLVRQTPRRIPPQERPVDAQQTQPKPPINDVDKEPELKTASAG
jgi:succinoglycan biosynthesis transport protein ExoP